MTALRDRNLILRARTDPDAADRLFRGLERWIWSVVWRFTNRESLRAWGLDDEDAFQEVALATLRALRAWDEGRGPFAPFAYSAAVNAVRELHRRHSRRPDFLSVDHPYQNPSGDEVSLADLLQADTGPSLSEDDALTIRMCLDSLTERRGVVARAVLRHVLSGSTMAAAAVETGVTRGYVGHVMARFRRLVRERLSA